MLVTVDNSTGLCNKNQRGVSRRRRASGTGATSLWPVMQEKRIDEKAVQRIENALEERKADRRRNALPCAPDAERRSSGGRRKTDQPIPEHEPRARAAGVAIGQP